jgi:hypothetical protein
MNEPKIGLPTEAEAEVRLLTNRADTLALRLGRADYEVAKAESARNAIRGQLDGEMRALQTLIEEQAKKLGVPEPWNYNADERVFTPKG